MSHNSVNQDTTIHTEKQTLSPTIGEKKSDKKGRRKRIRKANLVYNTNQDGPHDNDPSPEDHIKAGTSNTLKDLE
ncbi:MAG: hypothetical protein ACKVOK_15760 [Flavobacteriales bacterium]